MTSPDYYVPNDATRVAVRRAALELLTQLFAASTKGDAPSYLVVNNALVTASALTTMHDTLSTCPHCSVVHSAQYSKPTDTLPAGDNPTVRPPTAFYVDLTLRVPVSLIDKRLLISDAVTADTIAAALG